jgi:hypothetical protein
MGGFNKAPREVFVTLGGTNKKGQTNPTEVAGVLIDIEPNNEYGGYRYLIMQRDGTVAVVNGTSSFDSQVKARTVGEYIKLSYEGQAKNERTGREFKNIELSSWNPDSEAEIEKLREAFPMYRKISLAVKPEPGKRKKGENQFTEAAVGAFGGDGQDDLTGGDSFDDDDLPF